MEKLLTFLNNLGSRERLGVIFAVVVAMYFIMDVALLSPETKRQKALKAEISRVDAELAEVRNEMVIVKAQLERDPHAKDRAQLDAYKKAIDDADAFLAKVESDPRQVGALLRQVIGSTPGVTLVSLKTLPAVAVVDAKSGVKAAGAGRSVFRRGVEVRVRGNYLALLPYLEKLQNQPIRVLWAEADLDVEVYPSATLRLLIYTLSTKPEASLG